MARYSSAARTDVGLKREHNEDSFLVNEELGLYVVCDGMGGHAGGETASRLAVQTVEHELLIAQKRTDRAFASSAPLNESPLALALRDAVEGACAAVFHMSRAHEELSGMGTTCISLLVKDGHALIGHVGDSRAYLVRAGNVWQLSEDHSLVNEQVRAGLLTPEEARHSRLRNVITRSVGYEEDVLVDLVGLETRVGDKFVLCSDGLSNLVADEEIRDAVLDASLDEAPKNLIALANERGGEDNITVIVVQRVE